MLKIVQPLSLNAADRGIVRFMAKPLQSEGREQPKSVPVPHFGLLDAGTQSKTSTATAIVINVLAVFVAVVIGAATTRTIQQNTMLTRLIEPIAPKKVVPIKPKIVPPPPRPPIPPKVVPKVQLQLPKIVRVKLPDMPKPPDVKVKINTPRPVLAPPAPMKVVAMAAPKVVNLGRRPEAASVVNHDAHPTAVRLGNPTSPLNHLRGPAVAKVNLAAGMPGMNAANSGNGPRATRVNLGNGSPGSTSTRGRGVIAVSGIPHGVPEARGTGREVRQVNLGEATPPPRPRSRALAVTAMHSPPKVSYKPKPEYTAEARRLHIEGVVALRIRVQPNGSVEVLDVIHGLGHGLDESARRAILATKFEPATDGGGHPVAWVGTVDVNFQLAG